MIKYLIFILFSLSIEIFAALKIMVSVPPQKYFVEKIGGDKVSVTAMVRPGEDPHTYEPKPKQLSEISKAVAYYAIDFPFEKKWLNRFLEINSKLLLVKEDQGIDKIPMTEVDYFLNGEKSHSHENEDKDIHIWLSAKLVKKQAETILKSLTQIDITNKNYYQENYKKFVDEIDTLDNKLKNILKNAKHKEFIIFHPSWSYFARDYGLTQIPIEIEGKSLKPALIQKIIDFGKEKKIKTIFVQPQFSKKTAIVIAESINAQIVEADDLAYNWADNLIKVAQKLSEK